MNNKECGTLDAVLAIAMLTLVGAIALVSVCAVIGCGLAAFWWAFV